MGGYRLCLAAGTVDVAVFEQKLRAARQAMHAGEVVMAQGLLEEALALWRGDPLVELADRPLGAAQSARLMELRRGAVEVLADARLALGEHVPLVGDLEAAVAAEPLRERRRAS